MNYKNQSTIDAHLRLRQRWKKPEGTVTNPFALFAIRSERTVAKMMGISHQRVCQLERSAFFKIRKQLQPWLAR
jgi:hypothetical protein